MTKAQSCARALTRTRSLPLAQRYNKTESYRTPTLILGGTILGNAFNISIVVYKPANVNKDSNNNAILIT